MLDVKKEVVAIILKYFGTQVAQLYETYYKDKTDEMVLISLDKLLRGFVGDEKTALEMSRFTKNTSNPNI